MSYIQDDKEGLEKRDKLEGAEVPLRFQIPKKLLKKVRDKKLGDKANQVWTTGNMDKARWLERQQVYLQGWDEFLESSAEGPFEYSSSLHLPIVFIVCKTFHARIIQSLIGDDFRYLAKARREDGAPREQMISDVMRYSLKEWANRDDGVEGELDDWVWGWVTSGCGIVKWRWDTKFTRYTEVVEKIESSAAFGVDEAGEEIADVIPRIVEEEQTVTKKIYDCPSLEMVDVEDVLIVGGKGDVQKADIVQHRLYMNASELNQLVDQGIFEEEAVKKIIERGGDNVSGALGAGVKDQRAYNSGMTSMDRANDLDLYEIMETYWELDIDDSGINSQIVTWSHNQTKEVLRATYLHRISPDGRRPFFKADFFTRRNQEYGMGLPELLHPLAVELDAMTNMRRDFGIMSTMPFGFVRASSSLDPNDIKFQPGTLIAVDNPQTDVVFPQLGNRLAFGNNEEQNIMNWIERATSFSDLNYGLLTGQQGAARTATGARAIIGQSNANQNVHLQRLVRAWSQALQYLFHMLQKRIPEGLSFRVTGEDGFDYWSQIRSQDDIRGDYDFEIGTNSVNSDPSVRDAVSQEVLQLASNPLALQLGIVTPRNFYEALKNRAQALQVKDYSRYFTMPQGMPLTMTPADEFQRVIHGIDVPVTPDMDHQGYIEYFERIVASDELLGQIDQAQTVRAAQQAQAHQQIMQAMQQLQAQQNNQMQQQINSLNVPGSVAPIQPSGPLPEPGGLPQG